VPKNALLAHSIQQLNSGTIPPAVSLKVIAARIRRDTTNRVVTSKRIYRIDAIAATPHRAAAEIA
jgi:hypothetical protein